MSPRNAIRLFWEVISRAATQSHVSSSQVVTLETSSHIHTFIPFHSCADRVLPYESSRCFNNTLKFRGSLSAECIWTIFWRETFSFYVRKFMSPSFKEGGGKKSMSSLQTIQFHGDRSNFNYIKRSRELKKNWRKKYVKPGLNFSGAGRPWRGLPEPAVYWLTHQNLPNSTLMVTRTWTQSFPLLLFVPSRKRFYQSFQDWCNTWW